MELQSHHPRLRREAQHVLTMLCWVRDRHDARAAGAGALVQGCKDAHKGMTAAALAAARSRPFDSDNGEGRFVSQIGSLRCQTLTIHIVANRLGPCSWLWL